MGKPLVRFCEGPGNNEGRWVRSTRHAVVACDEASNESLISVFDSHDYLETPVYSKLMGLIFSPTRHYILMDVSNDFLILLK